MASIRILIADDHAVVREGTRQILDREPDMEVVAQASDGQEAVELVLQQHPRVAVLDISMPRMNGIEATRKIKELAPLTAVLVFTAYDYDEYVFAILEAGAAGYLLKNSRSSELVEAVRRVAAGESVLHPAIATKVLSRVSKHETPADTQPAEVLTERELDVLRLAAQGLSNREIADQLIVSPRTVQSHMANIFGKLNVGSRTEAVMVGLKRGWITLGELQGD
ncbi:MAG: response regulator transcription factor [Anaerolineales bacterium]